MPHTRSRYLAPLLEKVLSLSPIVGVLGHRQVGKTTLLGQVCNQYYSLDKPSEQKAAQDDAELYLKSRAGKKTALDEVQGVPQIFKELKDWVRLHPKPGQFILSGSIRFTSRSEIKESLTGRIISLELLPFSIKELESEPNSTVLQDLITSSGLNRIIEGLTISAAEHAKRLKLIEHYLEKGGLPGVCFMRDEKFRALKIEEQINTILDRDLRMLLKTTLSLGDIKALLSELSSTQGQPLRYATLKRKTQISVPTLKKLIYVLEALFLIRIIPIEGSGKGHSIYFEDIAEAQLFQKKKSTLIDSLEHFCFTQLRVPFHYQLGESTQIFQYTTRNGVRVPIAFRNKQGCLGIIPNPSSLPKALAAANSFLKTYTHSKVVMVYSERQTPRALSDRILVCSVTSIV